MASTGYPSPRDWVDSVGVFGAVDGDRIEQGILSAHERLDDITGKPYQFRVEDYGAVGNGKMIPDAAITAASSTLTSATAAFTSADVGKKILINEAGAARSTFTSGALITSISAVTNSTTVTLAAAATRTVTAQEAMYGTDDTAAIQAAMEALAASTAFTSGTYYAELIFDCKIYILATAPTPGGNPANLTYGNAQIPLPHADDFTKTKPTVVLKGGGLDADTKGLWLQTDPQFASTCLFSLYEAGASDATYGAQSVIGGPNTRTQWANPNSCNNVLVVIDNLQVVVPVNPGQIAFDFLYMAQYAITTASAMPFAGVVGTPSYATATINTRGLGLRTNSTGFNDRSDINNISIEGFYVGMTFDEHMAVHSARVIYAKYGLFGTSEVGAGSSHSNHGCWFGYLSVEIVDYCIYTASGGGGSLFTLVVDLLDNEGSVAGAHISDTNSVLTGRVNVMPSASATLPQSTVVVGAKNLEIKSTGQTRGAVTAPSVPATTVALQNPWWRDAIVNISGGTVTVIAIDGVATGLTSGSIIVPSGLTITLTYSSAPTWTWVLM